MNQSDFEPLKQANTSSQSVQSSSVNVKKENDWNHSDNSNHSQIAISTQKGDFLVEQIKNGSGDQSTYFLSPINSNKTSSSRRNVSDYMNDENVIGLSLQEILPDNNAKKEKILVSNPPNILKRAKALKSENAVSTLESRISICTSFVT